MEKKKECVINAWRKVDEDVGKEEQALVQLSAVAF
jgi:hypothetical protein